MKEWEKDKAWSDRFIPTIRNIVGPRLLQPGSLEQDRKQSGDLVLLVSKDVRIACRIRKPGVLDRYPTQITIRHSRPSGTKTEWQKVMRDGWGDWMFYGHSSAGENGQLDAWFLIDLAILRGEFIRRGLSELHKQGAIGKQQNFDGMYFIWIELSKPTNSPLARDVVIESYRKAEAA